MTLFLLDSTLGKLAKWLRIMGYDASIYEGPPGRAFLERGVREGRIILSRNKSLARRNYRGRLVIVESDRVADQISEVSGRLSLQPDRRAFFSRCLRCNEPLEAVAKSRVKGRIPAYVYQTRSSFARCAFCGHLFWPGTHRERMEELLRKRSLTGRP